MIDARANLHADRHTDAFTLIETMLAVLLMALLAGAVAMSFSQPLKAARAADAVDLLKSFDQMGRQSAVTTDRNVRLVFDLAEEKLIERDGVDMTDLRSHVSLPQGCRIDALNIDGTSTSTGQISIDISPHGWSRTYGVHLLCAGTDRWLIFAGLTGQMTQVKDESQIPTYRIEARRHVD